MSLAHELDRYLSVRRSLDADLRTDERILRRFVTFADAIGLTTSDGAHRSLPFCQRRRDALISNGCTRKECSMIVGSGQFRYRVVAEWAKVPDGWSFKFKEVGGVGVD